MKIVASNKLAEHSGIIGALQVMLPKTFWLWNGGVKPAFDMMDELRPDILMCTLDDVNSSLLRALKDTPTKIALFSSGVPDSLLEIKQPHVLCCPASMPKALRKNIVSDEYETVFLSDYANMSQIYGGEYDKKLDSDVLFIAKSVYGQRQYVMEILAAVSRMAGIRFKVVGYSPIPIPQFTGIVKPTEVSSLLKSCKVYLDIDGEMLLDCATNKTFALSNVANGLYPRHTTSNVRAEVSKYLDTPKIRKKDSRSAFEAVTSQDTCFHRIIDIANGMGYTELAETAQKKIEELL